MKWTPKPSTSARKCAKRLIASSCCRQSKRVCQCSTKLFQVRTRSSHEPSRRPRPRPSTGCARAGLQIVERLLGQSDDERCHAHSAGNLHVRQPGSPAVGLHNFFTARCDTPLEGDSKEAVMGRRFGYQALFALVMLAIVAGVGSYTYNLGVAHGVAESARAGCRAGGRRSGRGLLAAGRGDSASDSSRSSPFCHPVLVLRRARAILAGALGRPVATDTAACRRRSTSGTAALTRSRGRRRPPDESTDVKHILVVDDEPRIAEIARDYLERAGFRVTTAGEWRRRARVRPRTAARPHRPRSRTAADGWPRRHADAAQAVERADHHADGARRRERQADRPRARRRRLRHQAVQSEGAGRARAGGVPPRRRAAGSAATSSRLATSRSTSGACR